MKIKIIALIILTSLLWLSCAVRNEFRRGRESLQNKNWDAAVTHLLYTVSKEPGNAEYRLALTNALIAASNHHLLLGEQFRAENNFKAAIIEYNKSLEYNPENNQARLRKIQLLKQLDALDKKERMESPSLQALTLPDDEIPQPAIEHADKLFSMKLNQELDKIFKAFELSSGIAFVFDESFKSKRIAVDFKDLSFQDALQYILVRSRLHYKVVNPKTLVIYPDNTAKRKEYEELVLQTFYLSNSDPESMSKLITTVTGLKAAGVNKELNALILKGTPEMVKLAARLIRAHDKPTGEIFLDMEIIEVNRNSVRDYGIELSSYQLTETYMPVGAPEGAASAIRLNMIGHTDASDYLLSLPSIHYKLMKTDRNSRIKANPQLRVLDRAKVDVKLGDKIPVPNTTFIPYNTGGPQQQPITSFQQQDVGINLEITPQIHHDGMITLELNFDLSFITTPGSERIPPALGARSVKTRIRLRDNETSILAGLLRDTERKSLQGIPLLSEIPVLKQIFSGNKNEIDQTDIILTITPRIIRFPEFTEEDTEMLWIGSEQQPGLKTPPPLRKKTLKPETTPAPKPASPENISQTSAPVPRSAEIQPASPPSEPNNASASPPTSLSAEALTPTTAPQQDVSDSSTPASIRKFSLAGPAQPKTPGDQFPMSVLMEGNGQIKTIRLEFHLNPDILEIIRIENGGWLQNPNTRANIGKAFNNADGSIKLNIAITSDPNPGVRELAVIIVRAKTKGAVVVEKADVAEARDSSLNLVPVTFSGGLISIE